MLQEVHALAAVGSHPNLVRYHTAWIEKEAGLDGEHLYIQLEACDTSLGNLRALNNPTKDAELVELLHQVTCCLSGTGAQIVEGSNLRFVYQIFRGNA